MVKFYQSQITFQINNIFITKNQYENLWIRNYKKEQTNQELKNKIEALKLQLDDLDKKRIRAICENKIKDENTNQTWLEYYNQKILNLRQQIKNLTAQFN